MGKKKEKCGFTWSFALARSEGAMTVVGWTSAVEQSHCVSDDGYLLNVTHEHRANSDRQARSKRKKNENRQRRTELVKMKKRFNT